jgi:hypothetical protein
MNFIDNLETNMNQILLNRFLRHFREDNVNYNEIQRQQAEYVYERAREQVGDDLKQIFGLVEELETQLCTRRLGTVYQYLKLRHMVESDLYDSRPSNLPINFTVYDKGWRI